ncbi:UNVERIFIED_CONTAM: hypothetical protein HDU68_003498, partial [Siphonaria sp. JEL0065]
IEKEYAPLYEKHGLGTTIWSLLTGGILGGKYNTEIPEGTRLAQKDNAFWIKAAAGLQTPELLAEKLGATVAQLALAWTITNPNVSAVITGATKVSQVTENLKALQIVN